MREVQSNHRDRIRFCVTMMMIKTDLMPSLIPSTGGQLCGEVWHRLLLLPLVLPSRLNSKGLLSKNQPESANPRTCVRDPTSAISSETLSKFVSTPTAPADSPARTIRSDSWSPCGSNSSITCSMIRDPRKENSPGFLAR